MRTAMTMNRGDNAINATEATERSTKRLHMVYRHPIVRSVVVLLTDLATFITTSGSG